MQSPTLPIQVNNASASPNNAARPKQGGADDGQFSQALSREVGQRQQQDAAPAKPAAAARPQQAQQAKPAEPAKQAAAKPAGGEPGRKASAADAGDAADKTAQDSTAAADAAAAAANPALDMLSLVASLNLPLTPAPSTAPVADALAAAPSALPAGAMPPPVTGAGPLATGGAGASPADGFASMMASADGSMRDTLKPDATDGGNPLGQLVERIGTDSARAGAAPEAGQAKPGLEIGPLAAARGRELAPDSALPDLQVSAPLQQASLALTQAAAAVAGDKIAARVGTPGWDNQVGQKVVWMIAGKEQSATLTLNPPDMGPMQVVLSVTNDHASVTFSAAQPEVRQALEDAMPKLREMMSESGIALGNASVNDGAREQQQAQADARQGSGRGRNGAGEAETNTTVVPVPRRSGGGLGVVDTFA